jgi:hypothetical protein
MHTIPASLPCHLLSQLLFSIYLPLSRRREHLVGRPDLVFTRYQTVTKVVLLFSLSPLLSLPWGLEFVDHAPFEGLGGGGGGSFVPFPPGRAQAKVHRVLRFSLLLPFAMYSTKILIQVPQDSGKPQKP